MPDDIFTYEKALAAWEKMKQPIPERPLVMHPSDYALAEQVGLVKDGHLDLQRLSELRREYGV